MSMRESSGAGWEGSEGRGLGLHSPFFCTQARSGQHFLLTTHYSLFKSRADLLIIFLGYNNKKPAFSTIFAVII
jgi:hypothetical protein